MLNMVALPLLTRQKKWWRGKMSGKIIYLDIDGVLNNMHTVGSYDPSLVENLNALTDALDAKIVLSSSWRETYNTVEKISEKFKEMGIKAECIGLTEQMCYNPAWGNGYIPRCTEILRHAKRNKIAPSDAIIIDDDASAKIENDGYQFYHTSRYVGLSKHLVNFIITQCIKQEKDNNTK